MKNWNEIWSIHKARESMLLEYAIKSLEKMKNALHDDRIPDNCKIKNVELSMQEMIDWMNATKKGDEAIIEK